MLVLAVARVSIDAQVEVESEKTTRSLLLNSFDVHFRKPETLVGKVTSPLRMLKRKDVYKPLIYLSIAFTLWELSSFCYIAFYIVVILQV